MTVFTPLFSMALPRAGFEYNQQFPVKDNPGSVRLFDVGTIQLQMSGSFARFTNELRQTKLALPPKTAGDVSGVRVTSVALQPKYTIFRTSLHGILSWSGPRQQRLIVEIKVGDSAGKEALLRGEIRNPATQCQDY